MVFSQLCPLRITEMILNETGSIHLFIFQSNAVVASDAPAGPERHGGGVARAEVRPPRPDRGRAQGAEQDAEGEGEGAGGPGGADCNAYLIDPVTVVECLHSCEYHCSPHSSSTFDINTNIW